MKLILQKRIDAVQGDDTHCSWHLTEYTQQDIGGGLTLKVCIPCRKNEPAHPSAMKAGKR